MRSTWYLRPGMLLAIVVAGSLSACSGGPKLPDISSLNPFKQEEKKLPGKRVAVLGGTGALSDGLAGASEPLTVPAPVANASWDQPGGVASNAPGHLQLQSSIKAAWRADAGNGSSSYGKLTSS
ncbi:MAG: PQQ-binding-like beta-propeller repeat protein, partial [Hyphomicrobiaceae bacterium]